MRKGAIFIIFSSCVCFMLAFVGIVISFSHPCKYQNEITKSASYLNLDPSLIASIINVESSYNPNALSNKNAIGLMQIKLSTAEYMSEIYSLEKPTESNLFEPKTNILFGCLYVKYLINQFENVDTALAAYNAGETRVRSWLSSEQYSKDGKTIDVIPYEETRNYVKKVNLNLQIYSRIYRKN